MKVSTLFGPAFAGDVRGGVVSAAVAIPLAMGYGMFAFVALGDAYFAHGVLAGLWSAVIVGLLCVLAGNKSTTVYAPRITTTFYLGSVLYGLTHSDLPALAAGGTAAVLVMFFGIVFLGGAFQALFGWVRLGTLIKFTPHPVMAGFQNAAALLLMLVQAATLLGIGRHVPFTDVLHHLDEVRPLSLAVAALTIFATVKSKQWLTRMPPILVGLAAGTLAYYALVLAGFGGLLGPVLGPMPERLLDPIEGAALAGLGSAAVFEVLPLMVFAALGLAFIASMDSLLCERLLSPARHSARESDVQLIRLGLGNMLAALSGGITAGVNLGPSNVNRAQGSSSAWSVFVNALVILATLLFFTPVLALLPRVALSAVIIVIAVQHFDPWTVQLVRRFARHPALRRSSLALELGVVLLVALLSVVFNIVTAVFIGVLIAIALFLQRMSRSVVRRSYRCDTFRSRKTRNAARMALLARHGHGILVFELEGPIFFGSAERLATRVHAAVDRDTREIILDFRRVNDIDSTGATVLQQLHQSLTAANTPVRFSGLARLAARTELLNDLDVLAALPASRQYPDVDRAIEAAEDALLESMPEVGPLSVAVPFESLDLLRGLGEREREAVRPFLTQRTFAPGEVVFREGDPGTELFVINAGRASVELLQADAAPIRLATFAPGTAFGELAILDQQARSATVVADGPLTCYVLSEENFAAMKAQVPTVAIQLLVNLSSELSRRMRRANQMLYQLTA